MNKMEILITVQKKLDLFICDREKRNQEHRQKGSAKQLPVQQYSRKDQSKGIACMKSRKRSIIRSSFLEPSSFSSSLTIHSSGQLIEYENGDSI
jgi:hypothetical protein